MSILSRLSRIIRMKLSAALDRAEDPSESLDYAHEELKDQMADIKNSIPDVRAQRVRLETKRDTLEEEIEHHNEQAREAVQQGREDLARKALARKQMKMDTIEDLDGQISNLKSTEATLEDKYAEMQSKVREFGTKKETLKARHDSAEAIESVQETIAGLDGPGEELSRAEERIEETEARASALDELQAEGVFESPLSEDDFDAEMAEMTRGSDIEQELETLKEQESATE